MRRFSRVSGYILSPLSCVYGRASPPLGDGCVTRAECFGDGSICLDTTGGIGADVRRRRTGSAHQPGRADEQGGSSIAGVTEPRTPVDSLYATARLEYADSPSLLPRNLHDAYSPAVLTADGHRSGRHAERARAREDGSVTQRRDISSADKRDAIDIYFAARRQFTIAAIIGRRYMPATRVYYGFACAQAEVSPRYLPTRVADASPDDCLHGFTGISSRVDFFAPAYRRHYVERYARYTAPSSSV